MKIHIQTYYGLTCWNVVELPDNKAWDDVVKWRIRREKFFGEFKDGTKCVIDLSNCDVDCDATQYPVDVQVREWLTEDGAEFASETETLAEYHTRTLDDVEKWRMRDGKEHKQPRFPYGRRSE